MEDNGGENNNPELILPATDKGEVQDDAPVAADAGDDFISGANIPVNEENRPMGDGFVYQNPQSVASPIIDSTADSDPDSENNVLGEALAGEAQSGPIPVSNNESEFYSETNSSIGTDGETVAETTEQTATTDNAGAQKYPRTFIDQFNIYLNSQQSDPEQDANEKQTQQSEGPNFTPIHMNDWSRVNDTFVYPPNFKEKLNALTSEDRIIVITGKEDSGRFALAIQLGVLRLKNDGHIPQLYRSNRETYGRFSIRDTVEYIRKSGKFEKPAVYILKDETADRLKDIAGNIQAMNVRLRDQGAYFILTTTSSEAAVYLPGVHYFDMALLPGQLSEIYDRYLDRYNKPGIEATYITPKVSRLLQDQALKTELLKNFMPADGVPIRPGLIDQFFAKVSNLNITGEPTDIDAIVAEAARIGSFQFAPPRVWFNKLRPNARLYAMLVYLFSDFARPTLNSLYIIGVDYLRKNGVTTLRNPNEIGMNDLMEQIHGVDRDGQAIEFENEIFAQEVRYQINNYHHQLWMLMKPFTEAVKAQYRIPSEWRIRGSMGEAIGKLGIHIQHELSTLLDELACDQNGGIVSIAGSALNQICKLSPDHYDFVLEKMRSWVEGKDPDLMWAFAASIWRLYGTLIDTTTDKNVVIAEKARAALAELEEIFTHLAGQHSDFSQKGIRRIRAEIDQDMQQIAKVIGIKEIDNLSQAIASAVETATTKRIKDMKAWIPDAIVHAIFMLFPNNPNRVTDLVAKWLNTPQETRAVKGKQDGERQRAVNLPIIGLRATVRLFIENRDDNILLNKERHLPLLSLIQPALSVMSRFIERVDHPMHPIFDALLSWIRANEAIQVTQAQDPGVSIPRFNWEDAIHTELLRIVNRATREERQHLRVVLSDQWLRDKNATARRIAQSIVARSLVMDGEQLLLPGQGKGLIVVDITGAGRNESASIDAGRRLYELLEPRIDLELAFLGMEGMPIRSFSDMREYTALIDQVGTATVPLLYPVLHPNIPVGAVEHWSPDQTADSLISPNPINVEDYRFVLVLTWSEILDMEDVVDTPWRKLLVEIGINDVKTNQILVSDGQMTNTRLKLVCPKSWEVNPLYLNTIARVIGIRLARVIATMSAAEIWQSLQAYDVPSGSDIVGMKAYLNEKIGNLDGIDTANHPRDVTRTIAMCLIWMAKIDLQAVIDLLKDWLSQKDEQAPLYPMLGSAGARLLFNIYAYTEDPLPVPAYEQMLGLLRPLAENFVNLDDYDGITVAFWTLRRWIHSKAWYERITRFPTEGVNNEVYEVIDLCREKGAVYFSQLLRQLDNAIPHEGERELSDNVHFWVKQLEFYLSLGSGQSLPELDNGQSYGVIAIDAGQHQHREVFAACVKKFLEQIQAACKINPAFKIVPVVYWMGKTQPLAVGSENPLQIHQLISPVRLPRLMSSLLEPDRYGSPVSFVAVFTNSEIYDSDDWYDEWQAKTLIYSPHNIRETAWGKKYRSIEVKGTSAENIATAVMAQVLPVALRQQSLVTQP